MSYDSVLDQLYVAAGSTLYAFQGEELLWTFEGNGLVADGVAIAYDSQLILATQTGYLYMINPLTGASNLEQQLSEFITSVPVVDSDNNLILSTNQGNIISIKY